MRMRVGRGSVKGRKESVIVKHLGGGNIEKCDGRERERDGIRKKGLKRYLSRSALFSVIC